MGEGSNPSSDKSFTFINSRVAQWKRAGPITQRSVDRNYALLRNIFFNHFSLSFFSVKNKYCRFSMKSVLHTIPRHVPLAQRIARWTSNPKVLGSIPRWDEHDFLPFGPLKAKSQLQALK